jgi:hypothetical protein
MRSRPESAGETVKDLASNVGEKAKQAGSAVARTASDAASAVGQKADSAAAAVGGGMRSLADTIREKTPDEGMLGRASSAVASKLESGGKYLEMEGITGLAEDVTNLVRRNPIPALILGVGVGFMLARLLMPRR